MWILSETQLNQFIGQYLWPLFRITALFMAMPVIGSQVVPARARLGLGIALTLVVTPLLPPLPEVPLLSVQSGLIVIQQLLIGLTIGFFLQVVFQIFVLAGQFIAMKMGLGFAAMNDPASGVSVTVISQYYLIMATLLFLSLDGHLLAIELIVESFRVLPIGGPSLGPDIFWRMASSGSWLFSEALLVALPILTSLLVVNLAFGVMSRSAPQMNVFAIGFPITLILGLWLMWIGNRDLGSLFESVLEEGISFLDNLLGIP